MKEINKDKLWELYQETVEELQEFLWLEHFEINLEWRRELWASASMNITYKYQRATLIFKNDILYDDEHIRNIDYNIITRLFIHELFHIFCSVWTSYLESEADNLLKSWGQKEFAMHNNAMITLEEQMVCTLEKTFVKHFEKTKEYKKLESRFNKVLK